MAEKIVTLRKRRGWSQEELADKLNVSRQAVSKWESCAAMPEPDKIVAMSGLFGVSADYLLKDDADFDVPHGAGNAASERFVSGEEARKYVALMRGTAGKIALAVALLFISPVILLLLCGLHVQDTMGITTAMVIGFGVAALLIIAAVGVSIIIRCRLRLADFAYLATATVTLNPEVRAELKEKKTAYNGAFTASIIGGVIIGVLAVVMLFIIVAMEIDEFVTLFVTSIMLVLFAVTAFITVRAGNIRGSYSTLLMEDRYTAENKKINRRMNVISVAYWCVALAVYLAVSFGTWDWHLTWITWPIAGILFAAVEVVLPFVFKSKK